MMLICFYYVVALIQNTTKIPLRRTQAGQQPHRAPLFVYIVSSGQRKGEKPCTHCTSEQSIGQLDLHTSISITTIKRYVKQYMSRNLTLLAKGKVLVTAYTSTNKFYTKLLST